MGRTLHYEVKPINGKFSKKELEKLYDTGRIFTERCKWTCETFCINPYATYPDWNSNSTWKKYEKRYNELAEQELHHNEINKQLVKEKIASLHRKNPQTGFYGFTKTGGNEANSLQVIMGLLAASRVVKKARIFLHDEGELIIGSYIIIEQGSAQFNTEKQKQQIGYLLGKVLFDKGYANHKDSFIKKAKELYDLVEKYSLDDEFYPITDFLRPVNPKDFEDSPEYGAAQIMAGFEGEYFGLNSTDSEAESYRMIALFQKMIPNDMKLEVTPKLKK